MINIAASCSSECLCFVEYLERLQGELRGSSAYIKRPVDPVEEFRLSFIASWELRQSFLQETGRRVSDLCVGELPSLYIYEYMCYSHLNLDLEQPGSDKRQSSE